MSFQRPVEIKAGQHGFSKEDIETLDKYILANIKSIDMKLQNFRTAKLPEFVRLYNGRPRNEDVSFPWPGAANLQIQLIGTFVDELLSRVMGAIYMYDPLFSVYLQGDNPEKTGTDQKEILQKFLQDEAYDPTRLDLYRVEQALYTSAIKYGTGVVEFPWEYEVQKQLVIVGSQLAESPEAQFKDVLKRDCPRPRLVPLNKFGIDPAIPVLGDAEFFYTTQSLKYWQVKNLPDTSDLYKGKTVELEKILSGPDRTSQEEMQREAMDGKGIDTSSTDDFSAEWDFQNCYITYRKGSDIYSILAKCHKKSESVLYRAFNNNPENLFPVEDVKLSYDDEQYFGRGYAEMLRAYQNELSQNSNWRTNNRNFAMLGMLRIDPNSKLASILEVYPGVAVPAKEGEVEILKAGADVGYASEPDQFIMSLAKERAGVDPAIGGTGGGIVNAKRGIYSAAGTSMVMTQQNNRNNLRMSDMRSAHVRLGIKLMKLYSTIGIGSELGKYGDQAPVLKAAMESFKSGRLGFRLRPTTAANNKELERQNDILLTQALSRFHQENASMLQAIMQPGMPKELAEYYKQALIGNIALFKSILINFNRDDTARILPDIPALNAGGNNQGGNNGSAQPNSGSGAPVSSSQGTIPSGGIPTSPILSM